MKTLLRTWRCGRFQWLMVAVGMALLSPSAAARGDEPAKLAASLRFDLVADAPVGRIDQGTFVAGEGSISRMNWVPAEIQSLGYTVTAPITHRGWRKFAVRFVPEKSGTVALALMGPWEEASKGVIHRQEVYWDAITADGAKLVGGGFEPSQKPGDDLWQSQGGSVELQSSRVTAVDGTHLARTWHNETLATRFAVTGGQPVTLSLSARSLVPPNFKEMERISGHATPAHAAAKRFLRGANLGNDFEVPPGQNWAVPYTIEDVRHIAEEGFDHVRIPVGWHHYSGTAPDYKLDPSIFNRVDILLNAALKRGLGVIVNIHHFDSFTSDPPAETSRFLAIWRQLATHYRRASPALAFELLNEPRDAATTEIISPIFTAAIGEIRAIDPNRLIFVGPGKWNSVSELPKLMLPDDRNLIVTVHSYDPFYFTHQGASWIGADTQVTGIRFPGPPSSPLVIDAKLDIKPWIRSWVDAYNTVPTDKNPSSAKAFLSVIEEAKQWSEYYGRPIHFGEFGCYTKADAKSRAHYYQAFREAAEEAAIGWAIWDWRAGFNYWNEATDRPEPGMHQALFGKPASTSKRAIQPRHP